MSNLQHLPANSFSTLPPFAPIYNWVPSPPSREGQKIGDLKNLEHLRMSPCIYEENGPLDELGGPNMQLMQHP